MKEKILAFLKSKLTGVSESFLSGVADTFSKTVKKEEDIETVFTDGIIETLKFSATELQKEGDRRATTAADTALKNFREKHGLNEDGTPIKKPGRPKKDVDPDDEEEKIPKWAEKFLTDQAELKQRIEAQAQEKTLTALSEKVKGHEKLKDIPVSYLKGRNLVPKSEAEIDQLVNEIVTDYTGFKQELTEKGAIIPTPPPAGGGETGDKVTITDYLKDKFPDVKP